MIHQLVISTDFLTDLRRNDCIVTITCVMCCVFFPTERVSVSSAAEARRLPVHNRAAFRLLPRPWSDTHVQGIDWHMWTTCL